MEVIKVIGAKQHNLQNLTVEIPRGKLIVMTGPSGSGKSSLAFHTLYAEGQRRYVESLSAYARQFLEQFEKPDVKSIEGLSPAIAIEQRSGSGNPRSTIATQTEIHDYLRILYAAAGIPHDPKTQERLQKMTGAEIVQHLTQKPEKTRLIILAPLPQETWTDTQGLQNDLRGQGFVRIRINGEILELDAPQETWPTNIHSLEIVVDRLVIRQSIESRLADSIETALGICGTEVKVLIQEPDTQTPQEISFSTSYRNPQTGYILPKLTPGCFSFNSHAGACQTCHGLGLMQRADENLLVPDRKLTLLEGALKLYSKKGKNQRKGWLQRQIEGLAKYFQVDIEQPFENLPKPFIKAIFYGTGKKKIPFEWEKDGVIVPWEREFEGLIHNVERLFRETTSDGVKKNMRKFMNEQKCPSCQGKRLRPEYLYVKLMDKENKTGIGISDFCALPVQEATKWLAKITLPKEQKEVCQSLLNEVQKRLSFLEEVGLGYLALDRVSGSLSGGEAQRIRLATQLGAGLSGVLYVLDEPSIGLHPQDVKRLIGALKRLRNLGNTLVVVEHDEEMIREADWLLDLGPGAGEHGGHLLAEGTPENVANNKNSPTGKWLQQGQREPILSPINEKPKHWIHLKGAREHNLNNINASIPLQRMVCITGPSGSGKSTLINNILKPALSNRLQKSNLPTGTHKSIEGWEEIDKIVIVDQKPIGRSPRSNAATYTSLFDTIRTLFSLLPLSRERGYGPGRFSFNVKGGRCEKCQGGGALRVDMHFLADAWIKCDSCNGKRYNRETLEVRYKGLSISDVLDLTVEHGLELFGKSPKAAPVLNALLEVGLGYLRLGQAANTLSGGEAQRVKLATELARPRKGHMLYLLDEPTTGLHFDDVKVLLHALGKLRKAGHSLIIIEHHLDVIAEADWILDLGPGGGKEGGELVATGTPHEIKSHPTSPTGKALAQHLPTK